MIFKIGKTRPLNTVYQPIKKYYPQPNLMNIHGQHYKGEIKSQSISPSVKTRNLTPDNT
jgi:hypothetical protein